MSIMTMLMMIAAIPAAGATVLLIAFCVAAYKLRDAYRTMDREDAAAHKLARKAATSARRRNLGRNRQVNPAAHPVTVGRPAAAPAPRSLLNS